MNRRLLFFAILFAGAIGIDWLKFVLVGKPTVVNWESFVHPAWVITAIVVLFLASRYRIIHRIAFWTYLVVFVFAYLNIYLQLSETITYFCMIFNLVLTSVYFFSTPNASMQNHRNNESAHNRQ